jgi:hypothetical protein
VQRKTMMKRFAGASAAAALAVAGLAVGVAQGSGERRADWVTYRDTWVLQAGDAEIVFPPPPPEEEPEEAAPEGAPAPEVAPTSTDAQPDLPFLAARHGGDGDRDWDRDHDRGDDRDRDRDDGGDDDGGDDEGGDDEGGDDEGGDGEVVDVRSEFPPTGTSFHFSEAVLRSAGRGFEAGRQIGAGGGQYDFGVDRALARVSYDIERRGSIEGAFTIVYADEVGAPTDPAAPFEIAIIGGTGDFAGISGTMTIYDETDARDPDQGLGKAVIDAVLPRR